MNKHTINRIRTLPINKFVIPGSTPVVCFGNIKKAKVATLGINPSGHEFYKNGKQLYGKERRFETLYSLNAQSLDTLSINQVELVYEKCINYFNNNPYKAWFNQLENHILQKLGLSYYKGDVCHLDVVQWATNPVWGRINRHEINDLLLPDINFLENQLIEEQIEILLINGKSATEIFYNYFHPTLITRKEIEIIDNKPCQFCVSNLDIANKKVKILAWSNNLQSTRGLTNLMKSEIGSLVQKHF